VDREGRNKGSDHQSYGYANWYLNPDRKVLRGTGSAIHFVANGNNFIYIDWEHEIVTVTRWMNKQSGLHTVFDT